MTINFKYDVRKHEILKEAALYSYREKDENGREIKHPPQDYQVVKVSKPSKTGFYACVLKKGSEIIIAYRGTDALSKDFNDDIQIGSKKIPEQVNEAKQFAIEAIKEFSDCEVFVTGHSLGGALAQIVGSYYGYKTATFNPAGLDSVLSRGMLKYNPDVVVNYHTEDDFLRKGWLFDDVGTNYTVETTKNFINPKNPHKMEYMKPLNTAKIETKEMHRTIKEHLMDYNNRRKDGNKEIKTKFHNFINGFLKSDCPGRYMVSGYTRKDGTEVSSYERTCGAKHLDKQKASEKYRGLRLDQMTDTQVRELLEELL